MRKTPEQYSPTTIRRAFRSGRVSRDISDFDNNETNDRPVSLYTSIADAPSTFLYARRRYGFRLNATYFPRRVRVNSTYHFKPIGSVSNSDRYQRVSRVRKTTRSHRQYVAFSSRFCSSKQYEKMIFAKKTITRVTRRCRNASGIIIINTWKHNKRLF